MDGRKKLWQFGSSAAALGLMITLVVGGCSSRRTQSVYHSPYPRPLNIVVVPFKNLSGSQNLNRLAITDEFVTELAMVEGITVLPVNQVLAKMSELQMQEVKDPGNALLLSDALGADGVIAGAVQRWEPYDPPLIALTVQLYRRDDLNRARNSSELFLDPAAIARAGKPYDLRGTDPIQARGQVSRVFDASQSTVIERLKEYAGQRELDHSPLGWKKIKTQRPFLRFVSHEVIGELLDQERGRIAPN